MNIQNTLTCFSPLKTHILLNFDQKKIFTTCKCIKTILFPTEMVPPGTAASVLDFRIFLHAGVPDGSAAELREKVHHSDRSAVFRLPGC